MPEKPAELYQGDCLDFLPQISDKSINLIFADLPYTITQHSWDTPILMDALWDQFKRLLAPQGAVVLTATMLFAVALISSSPKNWFRYDLIWDKKVTTGYLDANRRPLRKHELILVFAPKLTKYNPQFTTGKPYSHKRGKNAGCYASHADVKKSASSGKRYPTSIVQVSNTNAFGKCHATQKPVELMEWIIKTYSDEGDVVLDPTMGSGSTGVAAARTNRAFIGIELNQHFFEVAKQRIESNDGVAAVPEKVDFFGLESKNST